MPCRTTESVGECGKRCRGMGCTLQNERQDVNVLDLQVFKTVRSGVNRVSDKRQCLIQPLLAVDETILEIVLIGDSGQRSVFATTISIHRHENLWPFCLAVRC